MSEIEAKRKEAIELVARYKFVTNTMTAEQVASYVLKLGKEMARKEIFEKIDKLIEEINKETTHTCKLQSFNRDDDICLNCYHQMILKELKQSLEEKQ